MKEHLFLLETNLQPAAPAAIRETRRLKVGFEELLKETVFYADNVISENAIRSNEFVTPYTLRAEAVTAALTGASIDMEITKNELNLVSDPNYSYSNWYDIAHAINNRSISLLHETIAFQKGLLGKVLGCELFLTLYPEMLIHDTEEAEYYLKTLKSLQKETFPDISLCDELNFWNYIMAEHVQFIDGMLDPTEKALKATAASTADLFEALVEKCIQTAEERMLSESTEAVINIRSYKMSATVRLLDCEIRSVIPPLLADHVLREANHYLRLLSGR